ncbi:MAG: phosphoribosylformylglycinamidine synthase subunit PurQ [Deltaproteobacteria bacterium]|jgi:phosphoribosylformylglycinamidine synthase|nr:phosphoribosylformylglycinamidine synthase subunit PurQ [Deltaproteobacteria bacterium]
MPTQVSALIITGYGTNCETECEYAARKGGADNTKIIHFSELLTGQACLLEHNFLIFPGGFLDGDDLGAAQAAAQRWQHAKDAEGKPLLDQLKLFLQRGGLAIGICNGFQLMVKLGLLPGLPDSTGKADDSLGFERQSSLTHNASARYEDRWCHLKVNPKSPCVFTKGLDLLYFPVRHGEGLFVPKDEAMLERIRENNLIALQYAHPENGLPTQEYPFNPNGSPLGIAGICDPSGRIFGLMPHPEALNHPTNHPGWTRGEAMTLGIALFTNGVNYLRQ